MTDNQTTGPDPLYEAYAEHAEDEDDFDEGDEWEDECGLMPDGQCAMAGSEHCDFCCSARNSEDFAGSAAWRRKHGEKHHER